jgi:hypothetical protein
MHRGLVAGVCQTCHTDRNYTLSLGSSYKKHSWNKSANLRTAVGAKSSAGPMLLGADLTRYRSFRSLARPPL